MPRPTEVGWRRNGVAGDPYAKHDKERHRDEADIVQALHPDERDADIEDAGDHRHQHVVEMIGRTDEIAGDAGLHRVPAEQQRRQQSGRKHIPFAAEHDLADGVVIR